MSRCICDYCVRGHLHNVRRERFNADDAIREFLNPVVKSVEEERAEREEEEFELEYTYGN